MENERGSNRSHIEELIMQIESGERPLDKFIGKSFRELFLSGAYRTGVLRRTNNPSELMTLEAIRIVGIREENRLDTFVLSMSPTNRPTRRRQLDTMLEETRKIPVDPRDLAGLQDTALVKLIEAELHTLAAMQISRSVATQNEIVQVNYPRIFMDLAPLPQSYRNDLGLGMASYFLKTVPFGKGNIQMEIPSH